MLGSNVPTVGGFPTAFIVGDQWRCECIQIYLTLSRRWDVPELEYDTIMEFKKHWQNSHIKQVVSHIPFLINLASFDKELWQKSIRRVCIELTRANNLAVTLVVIHLGSSGGRNRSQGISRVVNALNLIFEELYDFRGCLLIETMAGQGNMIGSSFNEIADILKQVNQPKKLGVCLDTAHVFQSGYDIRGYNGYKKVMNLFDTIVGIERIKAIHLNDSRSGFGSKLDRHATIGRGKIGLQMFHAIMKDERFFNIPKVIEVPDRETMSEMGLKLLRDLQHTSGNIEEEKKALAQLTLEEVMVWKGRKKRNY